MITVSGVTSRTSTQPQLRAEYDDDNYFYALVDENGDLTIVPSGRNVTIAGALDLYEPLGPTYGGTGLDRYTTGDIVYASATDVLAALSIGADGTFLKAASGAPSWAAFTWADISDFTGSSLADLETRSASDLSSGTLPDGRFPATLPAVSGVNLTDLNASNIASGNLAYARLPTGGGTWAMGGTTTLSGGSLEISSGGGLTIVSHTDVFLKGNSTAVTNMANPYVSGTTNTHVFQVHGVHPSNSTMSFGTWANTNNGPGFLFVKSRGGVGTPTAVQSGDNLGAISWAGADGTDAATIGARIRVIVDGTVTTNRVPTFMSFEVSAGAADDTSNELLRLLSTGQVQLHQSSPTLRARTGDFTFDITGGGGASNFVFLPWGTGGYILNHTARVQLTNDPLTPGWQMHGTTATASAMSVSAWSADANGPAFILTKSRGATPAAVGAVVDGDVLGRHRFMGGDSVNTNTECARIEAIVTGSPPANNRIPTSLRFYTAAGGSNDDLAEKMRLGPNGNLGLTSGASLYLDGVALTGNTRITESSADVLDVIAGGTVYRHTTTVLGLAANDAAALGTATLSWADLFLASGGVINWNNGNVTLTQAAGLLTLAGGTFVTPGSSTTRAGLNLPHGSAPTSPNNGDMWVTTAGLFVRIDGVTEQVAFV